MSQKAECSSEHMDAQMRDLEPTSNYAVHYVNGQGYLHFVIDKQEIKKKISLWGV